MSVQSDININLALKVINIFGVRTAIDAVLASWSQICIYKGMMKIYYQENPTITYQEFGGIRQAWVRLPGRPALCLGELGDPESALIEWAVEAWAEADRVKTVKAEFQVKHPDSQIYRGWLPTTDDNIEWTGEEGEYFYCLKNRRKKGKYQIAEAILINIRR